MTQVVESSLSISLNPSQALKPTSQVMLTSIPLAAAGGGPAVDHQPVAVAPTVSTAFTGHTLPSEMAAATTVDAHRPWFARVSYYYDTTKHLYNYTTSFRVVSPFARLGEATVDAVLHKVTGTSLHELDTTLVSPALDSLDTKVDNTLSAVVTKLLEGQQLVVKTTDDVVYKVSLVARKSTGLVAVAATKTCSSVVDAAQYTSSTVSHATATVLHSAVDAKDYTRKKIVKVSSSAYEGLKAVTSGVTGHVPYL